MVYEIQPLQDPRWVELVARHPRASVFHTVAWLEALNRTYGYQPVAYTTSPPGSRLENGFLFCQIASWITGRRLVSLPFSDHCEPLVDGAGGQDLLLSASEQTLLEQRLRYIEIRPVCPLADNTRNWRTAACYTFHQLDLRPELNALFKHFHKSCIQRKIQRAEREGLLYETGRSPELLDAFWDLLLVTRRRHRIPPQPKRWFRNLIDCFSDGLQIRVAFKDRRPVAAILTLRHKDTLVYKYGCSDASFNNLGGVQLLFWKAIQEAKLSGLRVFDLGRTDRDNSGLITFKDRLGATRSPLTYARVSASQPTPSARNRRLTHALKKRLLPWLPDRILILAGRLFYRHIA